MVTIAVWTRNGGNHPRKLKGNNSVVTPFQWSAVGPYWNSSTKSLLFFFCFCPPRCWQINSNYAWQAQSSAASQHADTTAKAVTEGKQSALWFYKPIKLWNPFWAADLLNKPTRAAIIQPPFRAEMIHSIICFASTWLKWTKKKRESRRKVCLPYERALSSMSLIWQKSFAEIKRTTWYDCPPHMACLIFRNV